MKKFLSLFLVAVIVSTFFVVPVGADGEDFVIGIDRANNYDWTNKDFNSDTYTPTAASAGEILMATSAEGGQTVAERIGGNWFTWWYKVLAEATSDGNYKVIATDGPGSTVYEAWTIASNQFVILCNTGYASTEPAGNKEDAANLASLAVDDVIALNVDLADVQAVSGALTDVKVTKPVADVTPDTPAPEPTNVALNKSYTISGNGKNYGHSGSVTDGIVCDKPFSGSAAASSDERHASWFCFYYHTMEAYKKNVNAPDGIGYVIIDLEEVYDLSYIKVFLIDKPTWGSPIPDSVTAYVSIDGVAFEDVGSFSLECEEDKPFWTGIDVDCTARYLKIEVDLGSTEGYLGQVEAYGVKPTADKEEPTGPIYVEKVVSSYKKYTTSPLFRQNEQYDWGVDAPIAYPDDALNEEMTNGVIADIANWDAFWADNTPIIGFHGNTPAFDEDGVHYPSYKEEGYAWIKVDLGAVESINKLAAYVNNMDSTSSVAKVTFAVSEDGKTFKEVGTVETPDMGNVEALLELDEAVNAQYVEYRFVSAGYWMFVSEVKAISVVERSIVKNETVEITASETAAANSDGAVTVFKAGDTDRVLTSDEANLRYSWFLVADEDGAIVKIGNNLVKASEGKQGFITEVTIPANGALVAFYYNASSASANQILMDVYSDILLVANNGAAIYNTFIDVESDYVLTVTDETVTIKNTAKGTPGTTEPKEDVEAEMKELLGAAPADAKVDYVIDAPAEYKAGDEITVTVTVKNITAENGIHVAAFKLLYDNEKLLLTNDLDEEDENALVCVKTLPKDWENLSSVANDYNADNEEGTVVNPLNDGVINVSVFTAKSAASAAIKEDGALVLEFTFKALEDAEGDIGLVIPNETAECAFNGKDGEIVYEANGSYAVIKAPVVEEESKPEPKPEDPVKPGDASSMIIFAIIALVAICGSAVVIKTRK